MTERSTVLHRQTKQETAFIQALRAAENFKPTPYKRPEVKKLSSDAIGTIVSTADRLGAEYSSKLFLLSDTQKKIFTEKYLENVLEESDQAPSLHSHHAEDHHDHSSSTDKKPVISRTWQVATVAGNAVIGAAEILTGGGSSLSVTTDGIHNAGDAATYYMQTENVLNPKLTEEKIARRRKIAHSIIAGLSLAAAAKAGYDIQFDDETSHNPASLLAAGASLTLNAALMATLYRGINRKKREGTLGPNEKDLTKHLWAIDVPSAAIAVGGAVAQRYGVDDVESVGAVVSGLVGAYAFRPTRDNLDHSDCAKHAHHDHNHGHGHGHGHAHHKETKTSGSGFFRKRRKEKEIELAPIDPLQSYYNENRRKLSVTISKPITVYEGSENNKYF